VIWVVVFESVELRCLLAFGLEELRLVALELDPAFVLCTLRFPFLELLNAMILYFFLELFSFNY
jgi:hypothetical protein